VGDWINFRLPPKGWFRLRKDRPLKESMDEYYKEHPEHAPPPGWYADWCAGEARRGHVGPLIVLLENGYGGLSRAVIDVLVGALKPGRGDAADLRRAEQALIQLHVKHLKSEGVKQEAAIAEVGAERGRSRRHIFTALGTPRKRKGQRR
jgi:hypothetical protein